MDSPNDPRAAPALASRFGYSLVCTPDQTEHEMTIPVTPPNTISREHLIAIVETACRAPSLHNSQPWKWIFDDGVLHLIADHARVGHHTDATGREVILSCGAALDHLLVASAVAGWRADVDRYPDPHDHDHLASVTFHPALATEHHRALGEALMRRHTDRLAFATPEPWAELEQQLRTVLNGHRCRPRRDRRQRPACAGRRITAHRAAPQG